MQNEFEAASEFNKPSTAAGSASASQDEDNASDSSWTLDDEPVKGCTEGTRVAAYRASTSTWRCYECGKTTLYDQIRAYIFFFSFVLTFMCLSLSCTFMHTLPNPHRDTQSCEIIIVLSRATGFQFIYVNVRFIF